MKKLKWIPYTIANTSTLAIFLCLYVYMFISLYLKITLSTHGLGKIELFYDGDPYHIKPVNWFAL